MTRLVSISAILSLVAVAAPVAAQPRVINGTVTPQAVTGSLDQTVRTIVAAHTEPTWLGYSVPVVAGERAICCNGDDGVWVSDGLVITNRGAGCTLEGTRTSRATTSSAPAGPVKLEGADSLTVLYRIENRAVDRIRVVSGDCELDAGGRTILWLSPVKPADSIAVLGTFIPRDDQKRDRVGDGAVTAIALHADSAADGALERLSGADQPDGIRKKAIFWLGNTRGRRGFETVRRLATSDKNDDIRKSAMFGLSQSHEPEAVPTLIEVARQDASPKVRGEAIFWLAQRAGREAIGPISERIEQDPDTDVKKRAVFALSQLPKDEGVPLLIQIARTNKNPAVRKQAMFWLGQSRDPRAVNFFAEILTK